MPCDTWLRLERHFRMAVHHYSDCVNLLDTTNDLNGTWREVEASRMASESCRYALLDHQRVHRCVAEEAYVLRAAAAAGYTVDGVAFSEDMVLGDQGQPGG